MGAPYQYADGNSSQGQAYLFFAGAGGGATQVAVDVVPGGSDNSFSCANSGDLPVAILSGPDFDATAVDTASVSLSGPAGSVGALGMAARPDLNADGLRDRMVFFKAGGVAAALGCPLPAGTAVSVTVSGETNLGTAFEGTDILVIVGQSAH